MNLTQSITGLCVLILFLFITSCANYKLNYSPEVENWDQSLPDQPIVQTLYLVGDAGNAKNGNTPPALKLLSERLKKTSKNSTVIYLGDNLYPNGMAPEKEIEARADDEFRLKAQLDPVKDFPGQVYVIPGNHDWYKYGIDGLKRQRDFIEGYLDRKDVWQPDCGCGDPVEIDLADDLVLILLDTEWWITDWDGEAEVNQNCEAKSRDNFKLLLEDALKGNREKNVIVAMHHPIYSKGPHGGVFTLKDHLFPLTKANKALWIPLPLIGSIYPFYRSSLGTVEDIASAKYRELREFILDISRKNGQFIFVSGHEHSLQYTKKDNQHFIVSGAGSKNSAAKTGDGTQFAYGNQGLAELIVYQDGSVWVQFWAADHQRNSGQIVFRKKLKGPLPVVKPTDENKWNSPLLQQEVVTTQILDNVSDRKGLGRFFWGAHYREAYRSVLDFPVLNLSDFQGGLQPLKKGGGYQTNSLRLEATDGRQYTMRSIRKDPTRTLDYSLSRSTFIRNLYLDAFNAAHPMAAQPVPLLAQAAGIYHTNPNIYFIPKQAALGIYNESFGDALYLVEERPNGKRWQDQASFGYPKDIVSTGDVILDLAREHKNRLDYAAVVRARLFDIIIGDWDRHDDQWRWARVEKGEITFYQPIPRDRDQAFSKYDGYVYNIVRETVAPARPLRAYEEKTKKIHWSNYGCRYFDATFLAGATWETWQQEISHLQRTLTDEVIASAFANSWPDTINQLDAAEIIRIMQARRDNLDEMGRSFYEYHAKRVVLTGTNKRDLFEVSRQADGSTRIVIYDTNKNGDKEDVLYDRQFNYPETKEIHLYGLDDEDIFQIKGETGKGSKIRFIGGLGHDVVQDLSPKGIAGSKTLIYDSIEEEIDLPVQSRLKTKLSDIPKFNSYNRLSKDYEFDYGSFLPSLGLNPDDGILMGIKPVFVNYGFKKSPFADRQTIDFQYAFGSSGMQLIYKGEFIEALGKDKLTIDGVLRTPLYTYNFYGLGNDTENLEKVFGEDYYRVRQRYIALKPSVSRQVSPALSYGFGPTIESIRIELTGDRFLDENLDQMNPEVLDGIEFLGFQMNFNIDNLNDPNFPTRGLKLFSEVGWVVSIDDSNRNFPYYEGSLSLYQKIDGGGKLVLATEVGGKHIFNNKFEFFQGASLGGLGPNSNFRGFRRERFTGRSAFYQNIDLRWKFIGSDNNFLPFSLGIYTGFDHGRVWLNNAPSDTWHYSYGGGFWISPLDLLDLNFAFFRADEGITRFSFGGNFFF